MQRQATIWIRTAIIMAALALCVTGAFGEQKQAPESDPVTKILKLEHVDPDSVPKLLGHLPVRLRSDSELGLLVVHGPPSTVEFVEKSVKQIDAPTGRSASRNVEITAYLVGASRTDDSGSEVPPLLRPVVTQLRERFPYQGYRLLETASLRLRTRSRERSSIAGLIPDLAVEGTAPASYGLRVHLNAIQSTPSGQTISINEVDLVARIPVRTSERSSIQMDIGIETQIDLPVDKTVVVGKAGVRGVVDGIFLVLHANIVD